MIHLNWVQYPVDLVLELFRTYETRNTKHFFSFKEKKHNRDGKDRILESV